MKYYFIILALLMLNISSYSKGKTDSTVLNFKKMNSFNFTIGGHGIFYSFGYERFFVNRGRYKVSAKIGMSYYPASLNLAQALWMPFTMNQLVSFGKHHAELGAGLLFARDNIYKKSTNYENQWERYGILSAGYRHQKNESRFLYKILFTPVIEYSATYFEVHPLVGGTIGYTF